MSIYISSTSNLLPQHHGWSDLSSQNLITFGNYGDWASALMNKSLKELVLIIFFEDVVRVKNQTLKSWEDFSKIILKLIEDRLKSNPQPLILAYSGWKNSSLIVNARFLTAWNKEKLAMEEAFYNLAEQYKSLYLVNLDAVFQLRGIKNSFDSRNWYAARCRLSNYGIKDLAEAIQTILMRIRSSPKKVLALDCDNTLWGGVVGEVGPKGIILGTDGIGNAFVDFQIAIKQLVSEGILLVLLSKNNENEVWEVFDSHKSMILARSDILMAEINWNEKARSIQKIAEEMDISLNSFVFWDDNPIEREKMKINCPEVVTIEAPEDVTLWPQLILSSDLFAKFSITKEDQLKNQQYRSRSAFVSEKKSALDESEFLKSIAMKPSLINIDAYNITRAEQLCLKTNQFNLRTVRYSGSEILNLTKVSNVISYLVHLSDRFGDHGIISLLIIKISNEVAFIDTFLMSCRVLGRHLEAWILNQIVSELRKKRVKILVGEYIDSGRNAVVSKFFENHNFQKIESLENINIAESISCLGLSGSVFYAELEKINIPFQEIINNEE